MIGRTDNTRHFVSWETRNLYVRAELILGERCIESLCWEDNKEIIDFLNRNERDGLTLRSGRKHQEKAEWEYRDEAAFWYAVAEEMDKRFFNGLIYPDGSKACFTFAMTQ
jgi:hypothetical protein